MTVLRIALAALIAATVLSGCADAPPAPATPPGSPQLPIDTPSIAVTRPEVPAGAIVFEVTGNGTADTLSYGAGMMTTTLRNVQLPWVGTVTPNNPTSGIAATVQAQLTPSAGRQVSCRISRDNEELAHASGPDGALCTAQILS